MADVAPAPSVDDPFAVVVGQPRVVEHLRAAARAPVHAYLFAGPAGFGTREAARAFAAALFCAGGGCGSCRACRLALEERHPDLVFVERTGASIRVEQIDEVLRLAARPPAEGARKVLVLVDFHLVAQQYPRLLKTLEEPPASTVFVVLADDVAPELVTIASRCVRIDFGPVPPAAIAEDLQQRGVAPDLAAEVAAAAGGDLHRARLLAGDAGFAARQGMWRSVPGRLDGSGHAIAVLVDELLGAIESVLEPLVARQEAELAALDERLAATGERGGGRKDLLDEHKRQQRRIRTDELRAGLATLAGVLRDRAASPASSPADRLAAVESVQAVQAAGEALVRNPNETLLLQGLFATLTSNWRK